MRAGGKIVTALVLTGLLCTTHSLHAGEGGSFSMITSWVHDYQRLERPGRAVTIGTLEGIMTILESSHSPFVAGEHSVLEVPGLCEEIRRRARSRGTLHPDRRLE